MDFGNPRDNPKLFAPENRIDTDHLNKQGAAIFSEALGNEMAALIKMAASCLVTRRHARLDRV